MTNLYNFDDSGFFTYESQADICQITDNPLMRINSTLLAPPDNILSGSNAIWDGEKWLIFTPETQPVQTIAEQREIMILSAVQARLNLSKAGLLLGIIKRINDMPDDSEIKILFEYGTVFKRLDPTLVTFCTDELKLDDLQIDELFK